jgi:hypothetical protein
MGELTICACEVSSRLYPALMAATNGNDGEVVKMTVLLKLTSAFLIVVFPRTIAINE